MGEDVKEGAEEVVGPQGREVMTWCSEVDRGREVASFKLA